MNSPDVRWRRILVPTDFAPASLVAEQVVRCAACPVLVIRAGSAPEIKN